MQCPSPTSVTHTCEINTMTPRKFFTSSSAYGTYDRSAAKTMIEKHLKTCNGESSENLASKLRPSSHFAAYATYSKKDAGALAASLLERLEAHEGVKKQDQLIDEQAQTLSTIFNKPTFVEKKKPTLLPARFGQQIHRMIVYPKIMLYNCFPAIKEAVSVMLSDLKAHDWLPSKVFEKNDPLALSSSPSFAGKKAPGYSAQLTFTKKFKDRARFERVFYGLCKDSGMNESMGKVVWNDDVTILNEFSEDFTDIPGDHYIPNSRSYYAEGSRFKHWHVSIDMYESEKTTIMQAHLPGRAWDGTSCFNFTKELVNRYYSEDTEAEKSQVFKAGELMSMREDAKSKFDSPWNIFKWAIWVPFNVYSNQSGLCWQKASAEAGIDGYKEIPKELCHVNFTEVQSKKLAASLKKHKTKVGRRGVVAPTAALVFAGVHAFKIELGEYPFTVPMQASLQTRSFEPSFKERSFVGDWLIGVLHEVRTWKRYLGVRDYKVDDAQEFYDALVDGLESSDERIQDGFYSRVLGKLKGGAAAFEKTPCYPGKSRLNDSLFFNNYGFRTIHEDSGCVGFNWSGAGKVGINCILINGRICCSIASTQLPLAKVEEIRDTFKEILFAFMEGQDGDDAVKTIVKDRAKMS